MKDIRVASVQFEHQNGNKQANLDKIAGFVRRAAAENAEIVVFPECCITGYWFLRHLSREELCQLAEPVFGGPSCRFLTALAKEHGVTIGAGLVEITDDARLCNSYVVAMPDGQSARHRKLHCFISPHMDSGSEYTVFDTPHGCRLGVLTCYDNNIVENCRITALMGAEILLAPHQTGGCRTPDPYTMGAIDLELWHRRDRDPERIEREFRGLKGRGWLMRWLPSRAHDNGIFLIFSNGVGIDDDEVRTGNAMILDPLGQVLAETWKADADMVLADLDASMLENVTGRRWMRTRRPELYELLVKPTGKEKDTREVRFQGIDT